MSEIIRITPDRERARDLYSMASEDLKDIQDIGKDKPHKIIKEYYEVIVQLITALMYANGFKTLSHVMLIEYLNKNYKEFSRNELELIDTLRKLRHGILYYGKRSGEEFLINHESSVVKLTKKLISLVEKRLK